MVETARGGDVTFCCRHEPTLHSITAEENSKAVRYCERNAIGADGEEVIILVKPG